MFSITNMEISTPVAFFIFNRPALTETVFKSIASAKPKKLLLVADGPHSLDEVRKCEEVKAIVKRVDWDCEVLTNFSDVNLGCKHRVSTGLNWVFSNVNEAIILEDDCLPTFSFFEFCQELLRYYRHDERVMHISGTNFQAGQIRSKYSYYYSKYVHVWGWASWRRAWQHYDVEIGGWTEFKELISSHCKDPYEKKYWTDIFNSVSKGVVDTWDYQWMFTCWTQHGLAVIPNRNLVSNIGFDSDATHTVDVNNPFSRLPTSDIQEVSHPKIVVEHVEADSYTFDHVFGGRHLRASDRLGARCRRHLGILKRRLLRIAEQSTHGA